MGEVFWLGPRKNRPTPSLEVGDKSGKIDHVDKRVFLSDCFGFLRIVAPNSKVEI